MSNQSFYHDIDRLLEIVQCQKNPTLYINQQLANMAKSNPSLQHIIQILNGKSSGNPELLFKNIFKEYGLDFNEVISYLSKKGIKI